MERAGLLPAGPVDEAQTPPASAPAPFVPSHPTLWHLERRLAYQTALANFGRRALRATEARPLMDEATALLHWAIPAAAAEPYDLVAGADEDELSFAEALADMLGAARERLLAEEASRHAALHDPLTGLANRSLILDHLELALARSGRRSTFAAVIFLDLDGFKRINDALGHLAGDDLLVLVAERLRRAIRPEDTLGRWAGDEFVLVCEDIQGPDDANAIAHRMAAAFDAPFAVRGREVPVAASIGVAISVGDDDQPALLIHAADVAMYRAKREPPSQPEAAPVLFPAAQSHPKLERLTGRLLDLLSSLGQDGSTDLP